jgi:hypothetical protein
MIAVNTGYEIQIDDMAMPDGNPLHKTGAIYNFAAPLNADVSKLIGQWNIFEIEVTGQKYTVILNDEKIIPEFTGNRLTEGYIGIFEPGQEKDLGKDTRHIRLMKEI